MAVNNEIGVIQPMEEIGTLCRENKVRSRGPHWLLQNDLQSDVCGRVSGDEVGALKFQVSG
jgi:cysteine sulfinate desulfinase/cysteine desulfurase-like protein